MSIIVNGISYPNASVIVQLNDGTATLPGGGSSGGSSGGQQSGGGSSGGQQGGSVSGNVRTIPFAWANTPNSSIGQVGHDETVAIEVVTGSISSSGSLAMIRASEYGGAPPWDREWCLSYTAGDFSSPIDGAPYARGEGPSPTARLAVGTGSSPGYPTIPLQTRFYFNLRNKQPANEADWPASTEMQVSVAVYGM